MYSCIMRKMVYRHVYLNSQTHVRRFVCKQHNPPILTKESAVTYHLRNWIYYNHLDGTEEKYQTGHLLVPIFSLLYLYYTFPCNGLMFAMW